MTTKELHEAKLIEHAYEAFVARVLHEGVSCPSPRKAFEAGYRDGYVEGLKWADNKKQIAATQLRDMLQLYQEGKRGLPAYSELLAILRLVEGYGEDKMPVSLIAIMREDRVTRTDADRMLAEDIAAVKSSTEKLALRALRKLRDVVTAGNRDGMDWGDHFGALMTALWLAGRVLPEVEKDVVTGVELECLQGRARLINRLQACIDDPRWPDHAQVSKKLLEECLSAWVSPLNE